MEIWGPLLNGGCIVVIEQWEVLDPQGLAVKALTRQSVNVLWLTVGLFNQCADVLGDAFSAMRYLMVGGDALDPDVIRRVLEKGYSTGKTGSTGTILRKRRPSRRHAV